MTSLSSALRATLRVFKFVPDKFVKLPPCGREFSRANNQKAHTRWAFFDYGAPGEIRTPDRLVRSQLLYPAELRAHSDQLYWNLRFTNRPKGDPSQSCAQIG